MVFRSVITFLVLFDVCIIFGRSCGAKLQFPFRNRHENTKHITLDRAWSASGGNKTEKIVRFRRGFSSEILKFPQDRLPSDK